MERTLLDGGANLNNVPAADASELPEHVKLNKSSAKEKIDMMKQKRSINCSIKQHIIYHPKSNQKIRRSCLESYSILLVILCALLLPDVRVLTTFHNNGVSRIDWPLISRLRQIANLFSLCILNERPNLKRSNYLSVCLSVSVFTSYL